MLTESNPTYHPAVTPTSGAAASGASSAPASEMARIARDALAVVERARFHLRKKGYDPAEVDAFLQECAGSLEQVVARERARGEAEGDAAWNAFWEAGGDPELFTPEGGVTALLGRARFHLRKKGYDPAEVDALLGQLHERGVALDAAMAKPVERTSTSAGLEPAAQERPLGAVASSEPEVDSGVEAAADLASPAAVAPPLESEADVSPAPRVAGPSVSAPSPASTAMVTASPATPGRPDRPAPTASTPAPATRPWAELVHQVVASSIEGGMKHLERELQLRAESEAMLLRIEQENHLDQARAFVARDCQELRVAAAEQCTHIVLEAERQAERALAEISEQVRSRLARVCSDARAELERIAGDESAVIHDRGQIVNGRVEPPIAPGSARPDEARVDGRPPALDPSRWAVSRPLPRRPI